MPSLLTDFDELDLTGLEIEPVKLDVERLTAKFGAGYRRSAAVGPTSGLWGWELASGALPDDEDYGNLIDGVPRFEYYETFFRDHTVGDAGDIFQIDFRGKKYHAAFASNSISGNMHTYDVFDLSGVALEMARSEGIAYADDGSILRPWAWLAGRGVTGLADGANVSPTLADTSGSGHDFTTHGISTARPTYQTNEVNSLPIVQFLQNNASRDVSSSPVTLYDVFFVMKVRDATFDANQNEMLADGGTTDLLKGSSTRTYWANLSLSNYEYRKNGTLYVASNQQAPMQAYGVVHLRFTAGVSFVDAVQICAGTNGNNHGCPVDLGEALFFDRSLSSAEYDRVTRMLKKMYAITATS